MNQRWDYGGNRHNQRNDFGPPPSYDSSGSKRGRYVTDKVRHGQKRHNRFNFKVIKSCKLRHSVTFHFPKNDLLSQ